MGWGQRERESRHPTENGAITSNLELKAGLKVGLATGLHMGFHHRTPRLRPEPKSDA